MSNLENTSLDVPIPHGSTIEIGVITHQLNGLQGEILTIIEAIIADSNQCKAAKDLVKIAFRRKSNQNMEIANANNLRNASGPQLMEVSGRVEPVPSNIPSIIGNRK